MTKEEEFLNACLDGNSAKVKRMLAEDPTLVNAIASYQPHSSDVVTSQVDGVSALIFAVISGDKATVEALIHAKAKVDHQDDNGHTALVWAVTYSSNELVECLLKARASKSIKDKKGCTAVDIAINLVVAKRGAEGQKAKDAVLKSLGVGAATAVLRQAAIKVTEPAPTVRPVIFTAPKVSAVTTREEVNTAAVGNYPAGSRDSARHLVPVSALAGKFGGTTAKPVAKKEEVEETLATTAFGGVKLRSTSGTKKLW